VVWFVGFDDAPDGAFGVQRWCVLVVVPIRSRVRVATVTEIGAFNAIEDKVIPQPSDYSNNS